MTFPKIQLTVVALILVAIALTATTFGAISVNQSLSSNGSIAVTPNLALFSNSACTTSLSVIDWGTITPGNNQTRTVFIKNTGVGTSLTLSISTNSWNPSTADGPITISWDKEGAIIAPGRAIAAVITLESSSSIVDVTTFSVQILISGTVCTTSPTPMPTPTPTQTPSLTPTPSPTPTTLSWAGKTWTIADGTWNVVNNKLFGSGSAEALITADNTAQSNYSVTMNTIINTGAPQNESSIVIRYVNQSNFYWMGVGCFGHQYSIGRILNGVSTELAGSGSASNVEQGVTYTLTAIANSNVLTFYVNGTQVQQITDHSLATGKFGIRTYGSSIQTLDIS
jgi:hypothetical protein